MRIILSTAAIIALGSIAVPPVHAQTPAAAEATAANPKLVGTWEGSYATDGPSGTMSLTLGKQAEWTVKVSLSGDVPPATEPTDVVVTGDKVTWRQTYGEFDVTFVATLSAEGTQLVGTLEAKQAGNYAAGGSFSLARK